MCGGLEVGEGTGMGRESTWRPGAHDRAADGHCDGDGAHLHDAIYLHGHLGLDELLPRRGVPWHINGRRPHGV